MRARGVLIVMSILMAAALAAGVAESARTSCAPAFQQLLGGLGFGPAVEPSTCGYAFDVRLSPACDAQFAHVPGGRCFCPACGGTFLTPAGPVEPAAADWPGEGDDAPAG